MAVASAGNGTSAVGPPGAAATGGRKILPRGERKLLKFHGHARNKDVEHVRMLMRRAAVMGEPLVERGLYDHLGGRVAAGRAQERGHGHRW